MTLLPVEGVLSRFVAPLAQQAPEELAVGALRPPDFPGLDEVAGASADSVGRGQQPVHASVHGWRR